MFDGGWEYNVQQQTLLWLILALYPKCCWTNTPYFGMQYANEAQMSLSHP
jgi:hypothetical protein